jgi:hypothetical protein
MRSRGVTATLRTGASVLFRYDDDRPDRDRSDCGRRARYKNLALGEGLRRQFQAEIYNALNRANLYISGFDTDVVLLDYAPASFRRRQQVQLAVKLVF